jgi:hypothetical protein
MTSSVFLPPSAQQATLSFWHTYEFHDYGGSLSLSTDGGNTFADVGFWPGGPPVGWTQETIDLIPYAGQTILLQFNMWGCWSIGCSDYWNVDEVRISYDGPGCPRFVDVPPGHPFYSYITCMNQWGIIAGYDCDPGGTTLNPCLSRTEACPGRYFRPCTAVTRGQLAKILANAAGYAEPIPTTQQTFADVPPANPFWLWIERLAAHNAISGYGCGGAGEPCDPAQRPYFRWGASATRGQLSKITALAAGIGDPVPTTQQTFADVPVTNPFWVWIEQLAGRNVISGYGCGGAGEPCDPQQRPYFRWGQTTTRGQMAKIATNTFYPGCTGPSATPTATPISRRGMEPWAQSPLVRQPGGALSSPPTDLYPLSRQLPRRSCVGFCCGASGFVRSA